MPQTAFPRERLTPMQRHILTNLHAGQPWYAGAWQRNRRGAASTVLTHLVRRGLVEHLKRGPRLTIKGLYAAMEIT